MKKLILKLQPLILSLVLILSVSGCANSPAEKAAVSDNEPAANGGQEQSLFAYVGAGLKEPVSEIAKLYEEKTGVKVELTFNNSGVLLNQLQTTKKGDIYMPGGMPYMEKAEEQGCIDETAAPIAVHTPVIITPKGNPAGISTVEDLAKADVKLILPEKDATALGKASFKIFNKLGISQQVEKNVLSYVETAPKAAATIAMGQGDAGITEYSNYSKYKDKLELIEIDPAVNYVENIPCAALKYSAQKELAKDFLKFMQEQGPVVFAKYGFKVQE